MNSESWDDLGQEVCLNFQTLFLCNSGTWYPENKSNMYATSATRCMNECKPVAKTKGNFLWFYLLKIGFGWLLKVGHRKSFKGSWRSLFGGHPLMLGFNVLYISINHEGTTEMFPLYRQNVIYGQNVVYEQNVIYGQNVVDASKRTCKASLSWSNSDWAWCQVRWILSWSQGVKAKINIAVWLSLRGVPSSKYVARL